MAPPDQTTDGSDGMDEDFRAELLEVFMIEFQEQMETYKQSLREIRRPTGDHDQAAEDLFRIFHTLKGSAGYFPEYQEFAKFASYFCERLRGRDGSFINDPSLMEELRLNYARLSTVLNALQNGQSMQAFRFRLFLKNF